MEAEGEACSKDTDQEPESEMRDEAPEQSPEQPVSVQVSSDPARRTAHERHPVPVKILYQKPYYKVLQKPNVLNNFILYRSVLFEPPLAEPLNIIEGNPVLTWKQQ